MSKTAGATWPSSDNWGRTLLENPHLVAISTDINGTIRSVNEGALRLLGYEREELVGVANLTSLHDGLELRAQAQRLSEELGRSVQPGFEALVADVVDGTSPLHEWCYFRKDGSRLAVLLSITSLKNDDGELGGYLSIGKDLTERKRIESALVEAEGRFRSLAEATFEGISISEQGVIEECNEQLGDLFGYAPDELIGMRSVDLVVPEHRQLVHEKITGNHESVYRMDGLRKDGSRFHAEVRGKTTSREGKPARVTAIVDVSEQVQAEAALRRSEERLSQIFHASPVGIVIVSLEQERIVDANESCAGTVGYPRERLIGSTAESLNIWPSSGERRVFREELEARGSYRRSRQEFRHASGEIRFAFVSVRLIELEGEACVLGLIEDVTEREKLEAVLRKERRFLEVLLENLHEGVVACDETGKLTLLNRSSRELFGEIEAAMLGEALEANSFYRSDGKSPVAVEDLPLHRALNGETVRDAEVVARNEAGDSRTLQTNAQVLLGADGEKLGAVAVTRDISERKAHEQELERHLEELRRSQEALLRYQAELEGTNAALEAQHEALRRTVAFRQALIDMVNESLEHRSDERLYTSLLKHAAEVIPGVQAGSVLMRGEDGLFRFVAAHGFDFGGLEQIRLSEQELIRPPRNGRSTVAFDLHRHNLETLDPARREVMASAGRSGQIRASLVIPVESARHTSAVLHLDNLESEEAFSEDAVGMAESFAAQIGVLVRQFRLERELEERRSQLAEAQRIARLGSWQWDIASDTMTRSPNQPQLFGLAPEEFPANIDGFLQRVHPDDRSGVREAIDRVQRDPGSFTFEYRTITPQGEERHHMVRGEVMTDERGVPVRTLGTTQDVSELKRAERALQGNAEALMSRNRELLSLNEIVEMLQTCLEPDEAYDVIARLGPQLLRSDAGTLFVNDDAGNMVGCASWGAPDTEETFLEHECWAVRRNQPYAVDDPRREPLCIHVRESVPSPYMCIPLVAHGLTLGTLYLQSGECSEEYKVLARTLADQLALALANLRLREVLRQQSIRDPLTNLFNRRYLKETLDRELKRAEREGQSLALIMLDVDHFKQFNDRHGHEAGDQVLQRVAAILSSQSRTEDVTSRYGGEEFALLMPTASLQAASRRAEELRESISELQIEYEGRVLQGVTLSLGVAAAQGGSSAELIRAADRALYRAKERGRNRVEVEEPSVE